MYGRRLYTSVCKNCGDEKKETDALGHTWGKGKVTRKSTYKVTSIGVKAFNCSKKLTKVTIGANIQRDMLSVLNFKSTPEGEKVFSELGITNLFGLHSGDGLYCKDIVQTTYQNKVLYKRAKN